MKYSIILPVYKVENYLNRCIESLINQKGSHDLEIILVDDGSPDRCPQICDNWAAKDSRFIVIHKENEGLGLTRNAGMKVATGDYIAFIDSDDYVELDYLDQIKKSLIEADYPDVCLFGYNLVQKNGTIRKNYNYSEGVFSRERIINDLLPKAFSISLRIPRDSYGIGSAWGGIYKRSFLVQNGLVFKSEREVLSEDLIFSVNVCSVANRIVFINECLYNYCENTQSLSHSYRKDRFEKSVYLAKYMRNMLPKKLYNDNIAVRIGDNYLINVIVCLKQEVHRRISLRQKIIEIGRIVKHDETIMCLNRYPISELPVSLKMLMIAVKYKLPVPVYLIVWLKEKI